MCSYLFIIFIDLFSFSADIDPEMKFAYKTIEELNSNIYIYCSLIFSLLIIHSHFLLPIVFLAREEEYEPFSLKAFSHNVKLFRHLLDPVMTSIYSLVNLGICIYLFIFCFIVLVSLVTCILCLIKEITSLG